LATDQKAANLNNSGVELHKMSFAIQITSISRIIMANQPRLWRELLSYVIEKTPDLQVVGNISNISKLYSFVEQSQPNWVIISLPSSGNIPRIISKFINSHPSIAILAISQDGTHVKVKRPKYREREIENISLEELISLLKSQPNFLSIRCPKMN
jgi:hypothetical protein